jgi:hypothetical protein
VGNGQQAVSSQQRAANRWQLAADNEHWPIDSGLGSKQRAVGRKQQARPVESGQWTVKVASGQLTEDSGQ